MFLKVKYPRHLQEEFIFFTEKQPYSKITILGCKKIHFFDLSISKKYFKSSVICKGYFWISKWLRKTCYKYGPVLTYLEISKKRTTKQIITIILSYDYYTTSLCLSSGIFCHLCFVASGKAITHSTLS